MWIGHVSDHQLSRADAATVTALNFRSPVYL